MTSPEPQPLDLEALEAVAKAATPGPWMGPRVTDQEPPGWVGVYCADEDGQPIPGEILVTIGRHDESQVTEDATYIATFAPPTVLALIERARLLEGALRELSELEASEMDEPSAHVLAEHVREVACGALALAPEQAP